MEKLIKIVQSPFNPPLEVVGNIVIKLFVPYSDKDVTLQINPNIEDYQDRTNQPGAQVRQIMVTTNTDETQILQLDFQNNNIQKVKINNEEYEIKLINIGKENIDGQDFPYFELLISW